MKLCPKCRFEIPQEATRCGHCGSSLTHTFRNVVLIIGGALLFLLLLGTIIEGAKSPEEIARERARSCIQGATYRLAGRGLSNDEVRLGAIMACSDEMRALDRSGRPRESTPTEKQAQRREIDELIRRRESH